MKDIFELTPSEVSSDLWGKIRRHLITRVNDLHVRNEEPLDDVKTASVRGEIRAIKSILNLEVNRPAPNITQSGLISRPPRVQAKI